ncbi:DnaJ-domain-containing protein [Mytilinidion resinicola]|uniref:DnaJ-domain-containing protein n=1 Tax=Mytilinidion resinicola TaxID=574789 RepID=A0A6A6YQ29_9PEZI|nr:DnaJ-domain-containing protein [Mytilinidion resinicola]KAF2809987.1 DnaJ-domain-containing protein [Mytilinidion resinicola]
MYGYPFGPAGHTGMSQAQICREMLMKERVPRNSPLLRPFPIPQSEIEVLGDMYMEIFGPHSEEEKREIRRAFNNILNAFGRPPKRSFYFKLFRSLDTFLFSSELAHRVYLTMGEDRPNISSLVRRIQRDRMGIMMNVVNARVHGPALHWGRFLHALAHTFLEIELGRHIDCGGLMRVHEQVFYTVMCIIDEALNRDGPIVKFCKMDAWWIQEFRHTWYHDFKRSMAADLRGQRGHRYEGYDGVPGFGGFGAYSFNVNAFNKFAYEEDNMDQSYEPNYDNDDEDLGSGLGDDDDFDFDPFGPPPGARGPSGFGSSRGGFDGARGGRDSSRWGSSRPESNPRGGRSSSGSSYKGGWGEDSDSDGEGPGGYGDFGTSKSGFGSRGGFSTSNSGPGGRDGFGSSRRGGFDGGPRGGFGGGPRGGYGGGFRGGFGGGGFRGNFGGGGFRGGFGGGGSEFEGMKPKLEIDPYEVLGLTRNATAAEIRKAYHKVARDNHPDRVQGGEKEKEAAGKKMTDINLANEILSDEKKRRDYDNGLL